ncbi:MAG TPA: hypothetical protein VIK55_04285 [Paludibacter sp.]
MNRLAFLFIFIILSVVVCYAQQSAKWGDQGDGSYCNPVLPSDYSDIDAIRVDSDYYSISSTFQYSPGVVILPDTGAGMRL